LVGVAAGGGGGLFDVFDLPDVNDFHRFLFLRGRF